MHEARLASCDLSRLLHVFFFSLRNHLVVWPRAAPGQNALKRCCPFSVSLGSLSEPCRATSGTVQQRACQSWLCSAACCRTVSLPTHHAPGACVRYALECVCHAHECVHRAHGVCARCAHGTCVRRKDIAETAACVAHPRVSTVLDIAVTLTLSPPLACPTGEFCLSGSIRRGYAAATTPWALLDDACKSSCNLN